MGMVCLRVDFAASVVRSQEDQGVCEVSDVFCFRGLRDVSFWQLQLKKLPHGRWKRINEY